MNDMWWDTADHLYDKSEDLFDRDPGFFDKKAKNGKKVFWSRGNGWVMGGTVRVLQYLPADYPDRAKYVKLHQAMAARLAKLQGEDGLCASLSTPTSSRRPRPAAPPSTATPSPGASTTARWTAIRSCPSRRRRGRGLVGAVNKEGRLGYVQQVGAARADPPRRDAGVRGRRLSAGGQ